MKILLVSNQYIDIREDGCWCNYALYGTLENINVMGELFVVADKLRNDRTPAQPINCHIPFLDKNHVMYLLPTNRSISSFLPNSWANKELLCKEIPTADLVIGYAPLDAAEIAQKIAKKNGIPFLCFLVACPWDSLHNHQRFLARLMAPWRYFKTLRMVRESNYVHYVTREFLQKRYPTKGKALGCSDVNLGKIDDKALTRRLIKIDSKKDNIVNLVTTANTDVRYKGQEYVIKALAELKKKGITKYRYYIIGGGTGLYLKNLCRELKVEDCVIFCGRKTTLEVFEILQNSDIYIQPSLQEGLPRSVVEAMSYALPCIGFKTGGIPELLNPKYVIKKKSVNGIINALLLLDNKEEYIHEAHRSFEMAKLYDHDRLQSQIRDFFMSVRKDIESSYV